MSTALKTRNRSHKSNRRKKPVAKKQNHVALVVDSSGSMISLRKGAIKAVNEQIAAIREQSKLHNQETFVTVVFFNTNRSLQFFAKNVEDCKPFAADEYLPDGNTALLDAVGQTVEDMKKAHSKLSGMSFVVMTITDGYENASQKVTSSQLTKLIRDLQATDKWSFVFQVPPGKYKDDLARTFGVPSGNIEEWENTEEGLEHINLRSLTGIQNFYTARASGQTCTKGFYTTNLGSVTKSQIKRTLVDIAADVKIWTVEKECDIQSFCNVKNGSYEKGAAFYQLTKPEDVQEYKKFLIMEKGKREVYAGEDARSVLNLPDTGTIRLHPGNHANYDIFVQSNSTNRKLVRGTRLVYWPSN